MSGKENIKKEQVVNQTEDAQDAGNNTEEIQVVYLPIDMIVPHPLLDTGIRDEKKFQELVEDINEHGLNQAVVVRPTGEEFELGIGHHRWRAVKELEWKTIKAEIRHINDDSLWSEIIVTDNLRRTDYSQSQLENLTNILWETGKYKDYEELGKKLNVTGNWVKNRIEARKLRLEIKKKYPKVTLDNVSTQTILDATKIKENRGGQGYADFVKLLELANNDKYKPSKIKEMAEVLPTWSPELRNRVLYDDDSYGRIKSELENQADKSTPKADIQVKSPTTKTKNPKFLIDTYEQLNSRLSSYLKGLDKKQKSEAIRYIKVIVKLLCEVLCEEKEITKLNYKLVYDDVLRVLITPHNYTGDEDLQKLAKYLGDNFKDESEEDEITSDDIREDEERIGS
ncbi:MAG: ParB/RepB/Spo0J family partition protein [Candidatus Heimdallarchaeaceae archaeon]|jgi:ParB/RepB/Spo0J family partition protein